MSPDSCSQLQLESKSTNNDKKNFSINYNPSLLADFTVSAITGGHGGVKRERAFGDEIGDRKESVGLKTK